MKRKLLPVFLSFALLANGSLTAFAADPVADAVTESDVQTTVSEDQENQEEVTVPEGETSEEEASTEADDSKETSNVITDIAGRYTELGTDGNPIDGSKAIENAKAGSGVIVDVRTPENYNKGYIEGSISAPVFTSDGVVKRSDEPTAVAFTETVTGNSALEGKEIYVLCNSGSRGARAATALLADNGVDKNTIYTITGGAKDETVNDSFVTVDGYKFVSGNDAISAAKEGTAYVIDVRSTKAQAKTGTLKGSISQSLFDADNKLDTAEAEALEKAFKEEIPSKITEDKPIYIICNSGARGAQKATKLLGELGYNTSTKEDGKVYTITNGAKGLELLYAMSGTDGNAVDGKTAVSAVGKDDVAILDVRATGNYGAGHLKGSISTPVFNADGVAKTTDDQLSKDFTKYVTDNKATLEKKDLYLLCNSGASGARAATALLKAAGYDLAKVHTITGGAKNEDVKAASIYVSDTHVINKMSDTKNYLILDVRSTESYTKGHLKGSLSLPLFDKDNKLPDDLAKAFTEYVTAHKADFEGKTIYVLCNSGARGAAKATQLLKEAGITNVFTIENGAKSEVIQKHFVTDPVADPDTKKDNNGKDNNKNQNNGKTTTAATTKTGDTAPIAALAVAMLAALGAIIAFGKKKIVK